LTLILINLALRRLYPHTLTKVGQKLTAVDDPPFCAELAAMKE
jgi:hypothetical protein